MPPEREREKGKPTFPKREGERVRDRHPPPERERDSPTRDGDHHPQRERERVGRENHRPERWKDAT